MTHPRSHTRTKKKIPGPAGLRYIGNSIYDCYWKDTGEKWHRWETGEMEATANPEKHENMSCIATTHLGNPWTFWGNFLWTDESKVELDESRTSLVTYSRKANPKQTFHNKNIILTDKYGGVMVWCGSSEPGWFALIEGNMNSSLYQETMREIYLLSVCDFKLKRN